MTSPFASELLPLTMTVSLSNLGWVQAPTFRLLSICLKWRLIYTFYGNVSYLSLSLSSGYRVFVSNWFRTTASRKFSHLSRLPSCFCFAPCRYLFPPLLLAALGSSLTHFKPKSQCPYPFIKGTQCYREVHFVFNTYRAYEIWGFLSGVAEDWCLLRSNVRFDQ
jgi:hypothetical protein